MCITVSRSRFEILFFLLLLIAAGCASSPPSDQRPASSRWDELRGHNAPARGAAEAPYDPDMPPPLYQLIAHPQPGSFVLSPPWKGREQVVAKTGIPALSQKWVHEEREHTLDFNSFIYFEEEDFGQAGRSTVGHRAADNTLHDLYHHRDRLPDNERILSCPTRAEIKSLLGTGEGLEVWGPPEELHTSEGWHFFTLKDASTIETLSVSCLFTHRQNTEEWTIAGLRIARGTASPEHP